ncbi:uncharacterized protein FIESC28_03224 [Fusarium coffeatum]|uniref:Epoxide hydrolase N-terminal domain-containing protein n=1 Tax=Fusarium coffeatum TaxID=231269 RepID=A0A366S3M7_9HYPO|nr:uncharacterized protein FIESC28_03224 [Fusarium coffeatum]RBR23914.1 hypothetical protein FIESC28_03224 [Fusarium coffeatum]
MSAPAPLPFSFPTGLTSPQPFNISVNQDFIEQTQAKVKTWRSPRVLSTNWTNEGPSTDALDEIAQYWSNEYDWLSVQDRINKEGNHYATSVVSDRNYTAAVPLHFVHHRSTKSDALPLLLLHGWPSSYLEWSKVIDPLVNNVDTPFHVVAPDLPGFGFSPAPSQPDLTPRESGRIMDGLMKQLGYTTYGIVSTDLGWLVAMWMVGDAEESVIGHMTDFFLAPPTEEDLGRLARNETSDEEATYMRASNEWYSSHSAYMTIHAQKPLALSLALTDSPVGFLGWMWDLVHAVSDGYKYTYENLITDAMMLFIPGPYANIRSYLEALKPGMMDYPKSMVPTGVTEWGNPNGPFPELAAFSLAPRSWIERVSNVVYFTRHETGGHFPAVSQPKEWLKDVRSFFSELHQG